MTHERKNDLSKPNESTAESSPNSIDPLAAQLIATAYHEAGHAIMATILGRTIQKVTIKPRQIQTGGVRLGVCELRSDRNRSSHDAVEDEALILLAGMVAEAKLTGRYCELGAAQDLRQASAILRGRGGNETQTQRLLQRMLDKSEHMLSEPVYVEAIRKVAKELIDRTVISGRNVRHIVSQLKAQCR
jgi:ATP-dependent Zn protease